LLLLLLLLLFCRASCICINNDLHTHLKLCQLVKGFLPLMRTDNGKLCIGIYCMPDSVILAYSLTPRSEPKMFEVPRAKLKDELKDELKDGLKDELSSAIKNLHKEKGSKLHSIITCDDGSSDAQRQLLVDAGRAAGLTVERILQSSIAAVMGLGLLDQQRLTLLMVHPHFESIVYIDDENVDVLPRNTPDTTATFAIAVGNADLATRTKIPPYPKPYDPKTIAAIGALRHAQLVSTFPSPSRKLV
jgi:hypothetical protein